MTVPRADQRLSRVVIIDPAFLGDVVFDGPLVRALRSEHGAEHVGLVVRPPADAIARAISGVSRVHVFDKRGRDRGLGGLRRLAGELEAEGYGAALVPHPSVRSTLLAALAKIPLRIGSAPGPIARLFLTEHHREGERDTFVGARLRLLDGAARAGQEMFGSEAPPGDRARARRGPLEGTIARARGGGSRASGVQAVGLVLGSEWTTKRWSIDQAARFVRALDRGARSLVLIGAAGERPIYDALLGAVGVERPPVVDRVGGTVDAMLDAIASVDVLVAGDTGPLHVARAMGIPVVALFGPTDERRHEAGAEDTVLSVGLDCRPCSPHGARACPLGHHRCMRDLGGDLVLSAVERALRLAGGRG